jgi:streptogramin lyase
MLLTLACVSATPIPSGQLFGTFEMIALASPCTDLLAMTLRTDLQNKKPLFSLRAGLGYAQCTWSIASVRSNQVVTVAPVAHDLSGSAFTPTADGAFWFVFQGQYVRLSPNGQETLSPPRNGGFTPVAVASTGDGHLFSIEAEGPRNEAHHLRVVNLDRGTSTKIPLIGWVDDPMRSFAGQLFFRLYSGWPHNPRCTVFQITNAGAVERAHCEWENAGFMAVDRDGSIWQPEMLGVSNGRRYGGPVTPMPCSITNTAALEPHLITTYRDGSVWFVYANELWRLDIQGRVTKSKLSPEVTGATAMVQTSDGSVWILGRTGSDFNQGNLYHFIPAP